MRWEQLKFWPALSRLRARGVRQLDVIDALVPTVLFGDVRELVPSPKAPRGFVTVGNNSPLAHFTARIEPRGARQLVIESLAIQSDAAAPRYINVKTLAFALFDNPGPAALEVGGEPTNSIIHYSDWGSLLPAPNNIPIHPGSLSQYTGLDWVIAEGESLYLQMIAGSGAVHFGVQFREQPMGAREVD